MIGFHENSVKRAVMKVRFPLIVTLLLCTIPVLASSVLQVTVDELVRSSDLVFEGHVINKRAEFDKQGSIKPHVTFEIVDVYKGSYSSHTIDLPFLGGTVGDITMTISDLKPP